MPATISVNRSSRMMGSPTQYTRVVPVRRRSMTAPTRRWYSSIHSGLSSGSSRPPTKMDCPSLAPNSATTTSG